MSFTGCTIFLIIRTALIRSEIQLANDAIKWNFISSFAPHWSGIWEGGVKSVKHHLRRIMGTRKLTYDELNMLFV